MARLWTSGSELGSVAAVTNPIEWLGSSTGGAPIIQSTITRSGTRAIEFTSFTSTTAQVAGYQFSATVSTSSYYLRAYFYFATFPGTNTTIMSFTAAIASTFRANIGITTTGQLQLLNNATQVGSNSATLSTGQWYMIDLHQDQSGGAGNHVLEGRLNGVVFATSSVQTILSSVDFVVVGRLVAASAVTTGDWYVDDVALNDATGSFQNSYPGAGSVAICRPSAAGDTNAFTTQTGGTAGSTNNFTRVNEVTPDDATTFNGIAATILDRLKSDLFNVDVSSVPTNATINVVHVGVRQNNSTATNSGGIDILIEKTSGGTVFASAEIINNSTTWRTNAQVAPFNYPVTLYQDPDNVNWNPATWAPQIGYQVDNTSNTVNSVQVSNVWMYVDYTPAVPVTNTGSNLLTMGVG